MRCFFSCVERGENMYCDERDESYMVGEEEAIWLLRLLLPYLNELLFKMRALFSGDPATTMKARDLAHLSRSTLFPLFSFTTHACKPSLGSSLFQKFALPIRLSWQELVEKVAFDEAEKKKEIEVLLVIGGDHLVYLEISDKKLVEVKHIQLEYEISCPVEGNL
ncbi:reticulon-like protein B21 isoform X2 [Canna indica]|uniref:Reticulon-like protein B21 isoform X2 n=1 Tax=Canna indica TaxID=4628 RepID=A0AAQ3K5P6_9LILI|nr:reticulon-like protein B21 isoform X2 [Canna indica]